MIKLDNNVGLVDNDDITYNYFLQFGEYHNTGLL